MEKKLKGVKFKLLPDIPYEKLFRRISITNECKMPPPPYKWLKRIMRRLVTRREYQYEESIKEKNEILMFQAFSNRESYIRDFKLVANAIEGTDYIIQYSNKAKVDFSRFFKYLFWLIPNWWFSLYRRNLSVGEKFQIIHYLMELYVISQKKHINFSKYKFLCVFNDSDLYECFWVLQFQRQNIKTATLQHGQFNAWKENTTLNCALEFRASVSDYFLCWNKFTKDEAIRTGLNPMKLPVLGIIGNIGKDSVRCEKPNNRTFGIVMSHPNWEQENIAMIKAANILASSLNYKFVVKLHPRYAPNYFDDFVDMEYFAGVVKKEMNVWDYVNSVEFSIVGSTSVFVEMIFYHHEVIRYSSKDLSDKYRDVACGKSFSLPEEIIDVYHASLKEPESKSFDYLCSVSNCKKEYNTFFQNMIKN